MYRTMFLFVIGLLFFSQNGFSAEIILDSNEKVIKYYGGITVDVNEIPKILALQDSLNKEYKKSLKQRSLSKIAGTTNDWQQWMSPLEDQLTSNSCWCHAATGVTEGLLNKLFDINENDDKINLDELEIQSHYGGWGTKGWPTTSLDYIINTKAFTESDDEFPNYDYARYTLLTRSTKVIGIQAVIDSLQVSPVTTCMYIHEDFGPFFETNPNDVYWWDGESEYLCGHAMVIVGYNNDNPDSLYWIVKDSFDRYLKIGSGQCGIDTWGNYIATVDSSCTAKITPGFFSAFDEALDYGWWATGEWSYINSNYSLPSSTNVSSDGSIEITTGSTFTVGSNSTIKMATDQKIDVYGTLVLSDGDSLKHVDGSNHWGYLDINSTGTLTVGDDVVIDRADGVRIYGDANFPTGSDACTISNCLYGGLRVLSGSQTYRNILLYDNGGTGLIIDGSSTGPSFESITITETPTCISLDNSADLSLEDSILEADSYDCIWLWGTCGLDINNGRNDFYPGYYAINNIGSSELYVQYNYWGTENPVPDYLFYNTDDIHDFDPYNQWPNSGGAPKIVTQEIAENPLKVARELAKNGDWRGAINKYNDIIETNDNLYYRRMSIKKILQLNKDHNLAYGDIRETISKQLETAKLGAEDSWYKASLDFLMCETYVCEGNIDEAISAYNENAIKYSGTSMEVESLCRLAVIYADYKRDKAKALEIANKAAAVNPGQSTLAAAFGSVDENYDHSLYVDKFKGVKEDFDNLPGEKEKRAKETGTAFFTPTPNPFNPSTTLSYSLANPGHVTLHVYNSTGQKVATLVDSYMSAGNHSAVFDGKGLASGMYFYLFSADGVQKSGRMTLVK